MLAWRSGHHLRAIRENSDHQTESNSIAVFQVRTSDRVSPKAIGAVRVGSYKNQNSNVRYFIMDRAFSQGRNHQITNYTPTLMANTLLRGRDWSDTLLQQRLMLFVGRGGLTKEDTPRLTKTQPLQKG